MNETRKNLEETMQKKPVLYITRDRERALGMEEKKGYSIISNENNETLDTFDLLKSIRVEKFMKENPTASILVFQNNSRIERLCKEKGWKLLNPNAELSKKVEEKLSQIEWLNELTNLLPPHKVTKLKNVMWQGEKFVLQFNHSHTGEGTYIIDSEENLGVLVRDFPDREARIAEYIDGPVFTANVVVGNEILVGNISYQITGIKPFTDVPFATIGNDWALPYKILKKEEGAEIERMARVIGARLKNDGWLGLFGIDVIQDRETRKIYLLEINARQPASTTFESELQRGTGDELTIFEAHIFALLKNSLSNIKIQRINSGAQIVQRVTKNINAKNIKVDEIELVKNGFKMIRYDNTTLNKDLLRVQSKNAFMEAHCKLSKDGLLVRDNINFA